MVFEHNTEAQANIRVIDGQAYSIIDPKSSGKVDKGFYGRGWDYVVDYNESPAIQQLYDRIVMALEESTYDDLAKVSLVRDIVSGAFPIRAIPQVSDLADRLRRGEGSKKLSLDDFVEAGVGNCSQTMLTIMLLVEKLRENNQIAGDFRLSEEYWSNDFTSGGHTWGIYTAPDGRRTVVDIVRDYLGDEEGYKKILEQVKHETLTEF